MRNKPTNPPKTNPKQTYKKLREQRKEKEEQRVRKSFEDIRNKIKDIHIGDPVKAKRL